MADMIDAVQVSAQALSALEAGKYLAKLGADLVDPHLPRTRTPEKTLNDALPPPCKHCTYDQQTDPVGHTNWLLAQSQGRGRITLTRCTTPINFWIDLVWPLLEREWSLLWERIFR